ncbi:hypothetical protein HIM_01186 [Hirsutella minnesotensis 3608]|nr:hypothetical protein HIM_01186 [Hirsutella minnesotensis 3608]
MTPPVSQGKECLVYDATDACYIDPETFRMINPTMDWWFRDKPVDPELSSKLLGRLVIGRIPDGAHVSSVELTAFFREIPLPIKNTHPQQSCVTWATDAIRKMQRQGWVPEFEVDQFKHSALSYADDRMKGLGSVEPKVKHYEI